MSAPEPPWFETAVAVQRDDASGEGNVIAEGSLRNVAWTVSTLPMASRKRIRVSMPDRGAPPFSYAGLELSALLALVPLDRR